MRRAASFAIPVLLVLFREQQEALIGKGYDVRVSDGPGRYLCNYLYFKSLQRNLLVSD